jgi:hypothetical protein
MPKATGTTTTRGLAALAAALGDIEPPGVDDDVLTEHCDRQDILVHAAPRLPVTSSADAALALSAAAILVADLRSFELTELERFEKLGDVQRVLARLGRWMAEALGAKPLATAWPAGASPFAADLARLAPAVPA